VKQAKAEARCAL